MSNYNTKDHWFTVAFFGNCTEVTNLNRFIHRIDVMPSYNYIIQTFLFSAQQLIVKIFIIRSSIYIDLSPRVKSRPTVGLDSNVMLPLRNKIKLLIIVHAFYCLLQRFFHGRETTGISIVKSTTSTTHVTVYNLLRVRSLVFTH